MAMYEDGIILMDDYTSDDPVINKYIEPEPPCVENKPFDTLDVLDEIDRDNVFDRLDEVRDEIAKQYNLGLYTVDRIMEDFVKCS